VVFGESLENTEHVLREVNSHDDKAVPKDGVLKAEPNTQ